MKALYHQDVPASPLFTGSPIKVAGSESESRSCFCCLLLCLTLLLAGCAGREVVSDPEYGVLTSHPQATQAALHILDEGGSAFDAAVAAAGVLAVVQPQLGSLGYGSLWLLQESGRDWIVIDGQSTAPASAEPRYGQPLSEKITLTGPRSVAVPGHPAALARVAGDYGRMPLTYSLRDAIRLAHYGIRPDSAMLDALNLDPASGVLQQQALAKTLVRLAREGHRGFYQGETARLISTEMTKLGVAWPVQELNGYDLRLQTPQQWHLHGNKYLTAPLPSALGSLLQFSQRAALVYPDADQLYGNPGLYCALQEKGFAWLGSDVGDPSVNSLPASTNLSPEFLSSQLKVLQPLQPAEAETDHGHVAAGMAFIAVIDRFGNKVAATVSGGQRGGSGVLLQQSGLLMNHSLTDFFHGDSSQNALPTSSFFNRIEASKRPVTLTGPVIIETEQFSRILFPGPAFYSPALALIESRDSSLGTARVTYDPATRQCLPLATDMSPPPGVRYSDSARTIQFSKSNHPTAQSISR